MNNKTILTVAGVVVAVVAIILIVRSMDKGAGAPVVSVSPMASVSGGPTTTVTTRPTAKTSPVAVPPSNLTYGEALAKYGSLRIQFDAMCQAHPNAMVVKNGAYVMLDNRSSSPRTITLGTAKHALPAYGFYVAHMTSTSFPAKVLVDCGTSQNVATITIEK